MTLDLGWLTGSGPETPQEAEAANDELARAAQLAAIEDAKLFHDVFANGRGPEMLEWLRNHTIEIPLMSFSGTFGGGEVSLSTSDWAFFRTGQNSVTHLIEHQIRVATTPPTTEGKPK